MIFLMITRLDRQHYLSLRVRTPESSEDEIFRIEGVDDSTEPVAWIAPIDPTKMFGGPDYRVGYRAKRHPLRHLVWIDPAPEPVL